MKLLKKTQINLVTTALLYPNCRRTGNFVETI